MKTTQEEKNQIARINRILARDEYTTHLKVQVTRSENIRRNHGRFILVDTYRNALIDANNDIAILERNIFEDHTCSQEAA